MRSSLDYAGLAQLCGRSPIMRKIMRAHNRIIPPSLVSEIWSFRDFGVVTLAFWMSRDYWTPNIWFPISGQFELTVYLAWFRR